MLALKATAKLPTRIIFVGQQVGAQLSESAINVSDLGIEFIF
jgi:hypothetical protein